MERSVLDALTSVLVGALVDPKNLRNALLACLDLAHPRDEDAGTLRMILEDGDRREGLDEFRLILASIKESVTRQQP